MKFKWANLPKPFFAMAPMEGGTDTVFRQIVNSCGKPDVEFTEFTNVEGILSKGSEEVGKRLLFSESERPIIAQIWGSKPESFYKVAQILAERGFDGIDINMGCPEKTVVAHGCCSALIENPNLAKEIIQATREGANSSSHSENSEESLPISVKTRIGFKTIETERWIGFLLEQNLDALTVHFRTQKEMSLVPAHWEEAEKVVKLKAKSSNLKTVIIGNGDVMNKSQGKELAAKYGLDGIMIGRGVFHNPYVFDENNNYPTQPLRERVSLLNKHLDLFETTWTAKNPLSERGFIKSYQPLKRYFKIYISGFENASEIREKLMATNSVDEARSVLSGLKLN